LLHSLNNNEKVIMVTSTAPGEGKTTVTANLALSLGSIGKKVLLIDGDIRNPNVEAIFDINRENKQEHKDDKNFFDIITYNDLKLSILTFNVNQRKLWKIMRTEKLQEIINSLRDEYDYILIDTPPCGLISDASVISRASDTIVYVVQQDLVRISRIKSGISDLLAGGTKIAGCILNGTSVGTTGYGKHSYGGYGYGRYGYGYRRYGYGRYGYGYGRYGYGYGEDKKKKSDE
ncbi:MAG: CpsD/CapB family tyrosine-protein kinase, partial [Ruminococcus sp.]|nr:CpsD/CapB family tyrosine-protein kinase [Candidatus Copronaster equi]